MSTQKAAVLAEALKGLAYTIGVTALIVAVVHLWSSSFGDPCEKHPKKSQGYYACVSENGRESETR